MTDAPVRYVSADEDSARWVGFPFREGDIVRDTDAMNVFWIGISAQRDEEGAPLPPLATVTPSGRIVDEIIHRCREHRHTKLNAVDKVLVDELGKLRNPTRKELEEGLRSITNTMQQSTSALFIFLGGLIRGHLSTRVLNRAFQEYVVYDLFETRTLFVQHPSYVRVYKYRNLEDYQSGVVRLIRQAARQGARSSL